MSLKTDDHGKPLFLSCLAGLCLSLTLILAGNPPALAQTQSDRNQAAERQAFVAENTVFTFYHELGHALIDLLDVHVLGREEDAVDALAVLLSSHGRTPEVADAIIASAAESFAILDEWAAAEGEELTFWGEHSLDQQRFYSIICLYYGGEPDALEELADDAELPEERRDLCVEERAQIEHAWGAVLDRMDRKISSKYEKGLRLIRDTPDAENKEAAEVLGRTAALTQAIDDFNRAFATPEEVTVTLTNCEAANAFYDSETRGITLCYELVAEFADQIDWVLESGN